MKKLSVVTALAVSVLALAQHAHALLAITFPGQGW